MQKVDILHRYLSEHSVPELIEKKLDANSFLTNNFAYHALRIGNSIGDNLDISIEIIILDEIAKKYNLILNTTEHAELHTQVLLNRILIILFIPNLGWAAVARMGRR